MSSKAERAEKLIDDLIGDRPEEYGKFLGSYPSVVRRKSWWTPEGASVDLARQRLLIPDKPSIFCYDTLAGMFDSTPGTSTDKFLLSYIYNRNIGKLTFSGVGVCFDEDGEPTESDEVINTQRLEEQKEADDEAWETFMSLLKNGHDSPERLEE